jgi:hypothetical protein
LRAKCGAVPIRRLMSVHMSETAPNSSARSDLIPTLARATISYVRTRRPAYLVLPRRARRLVVGGAIGLVFAGCVVVLIALTLVRSTPSWWQTVLREDPNTVELAVTVEKNLINLINEHRPFPGAAGEPWKSKPWSVSLTPADANAWLNVRLPKWLVNQQREFHWPRNLSDLQVDFAPDEITVGARVRSGDRYQVLTATLRPRIEGGGKVWLPASWVNLGRLSVPASWVLERARSGAADYVPPTLRNLEQTQRLFRAFEGREPITDRSIFSWDGNFVRILDVQPEAGQVVITCQTVRGEDVKGRVTGLER